MRDRKCFHLQVGIKPTSEWKNSDKCEELCMCVCTRPYCSLHAIVGSVSYFHRSLVHSVRLMPCFLTFFAGSSFDDRKI